MSQVVCHPHLPVPHLRDFFLAGFERFGSFVRSAVDIMFVFQRRTPRALILSLNAAQYPLPAALYSFL